jgi:hypothetical protein
MKIDYTIRVFINCPFDDTYLPIFRAIIFAVFECGCDARCALEVADSSEVRIDKIVKIISECKYGIHDISHTELDRKTNLPRFNMPLELGMFLGAKRFGDEEQKKKVCLILDKEPYRYQSFISDIAGQDIQAHQNDEAEAIKIVRNWMQSVSGRVAIPGGKEILRRYHLFTSELPTICKSLKLTIDEMIFNDYVNIISEWLKSNPNP